MRIIIFNLITTLLIPSVYADEASSTVDINRQKYEVVLKKAKAGDAKAQHQLASRYHHGAEGVSKDLKKAYDWYLKAANQGEPNSIFRIGSMYYDGKIYEEEGLEKDLKEAHRWYLKAAKLNYPHALYRLGIMCLNGEGVAKDVNKAYAWFLKAEKKNYPFSKFKLAEICAEKKNYANARKWIKKSYDSGDEEAKAVWERYQLDKN